MPFLGLKKSKKIPLAMTNLTIRNLTPRRIELVTVERFEADKVSTSNAISSALGVMSNFLNATSSASSETHAKGDAKSREDINIGVDAFASAGTEVAEPESNAEVLRLTFKTEDRSYQTDVPSANGRSATMNKLDDGPHDLTVVYVPSKATLAVYSSAHDLGNWMRELNDDLPLTTLSIPGTHNSPTCYTALPSVRCQAVGVPEQLNNGVRFMDIRVSANKDDDKLSLCHSAFPISLTGGKYLGDMLDDVYRFLEAHSSETIIMSVKREGTGKGSDEDMSRYLKSVHIDNHADRWRTDTTVPTLGQARGKIVLVRRFNADESLKGENEGRGFGIDAAAWPDNCEDGSCGSNFRVQDFYEITDSQNIDKKVSYSHGHLERAAQPKYSPGGDVPPFFVNFLSASNFFNATCWPERIAAKVNPSVVEYLCTTHGDAGKGPNGLEVGSASAGVVVTDWVGANGDWDLVRCIVGMNARLLQ